MRILAFLLLFTLFVPTAYAITAPAGQVLIDHGKVLRGQFVEEHHMGGKEPLRSTGHFTVAPGHGLIWGIEKPFPTSTIITPQGMAQNIGGMIMKLPVRNLEHLYDIVGGALAGDWNGLEKDFDITQSSTAGHWNMLLTPRQGMSLPYSTITVTGGKFVETIIMTKANGNSDSFSFRDAVLSAAPLNAQESAVFGKMMN